MNSLNSPVIVWVKVWGKMYRFASVYIISFPDKGVLQYCATLEISGKFLLPSDYVECPRLALRAHHLEAIQANSLAAGFKREKENQIL